MRIAVYAFDGITMFHLAVPQLVFGEVGRLGLATGWTTVLWSTTGGEITTAEGYRIGGLHGPDVTSDADLVIVPSWPETAPALDEDLRSILVGTHNRGAAVAGLCLGAIPLADSGLIAGRSAVTHWAAMDLLRQRHADIELESSVLYVDHGDVLTSAGTASAIDACLHLVRRYLGAEKANSVARQLVVAPHRDGGQAQYIERPVAPQPADDPIGQIQQWALAHLDEPLTVESLAAQARMSRRSFVRHFTETTGTSPARWVTQQRLDHSRTLLETTDHSIDRVAQECGFGSAVTFRQNFAASFAITPSIYRRQFRSTAA